MKIRQFRRCTRRPTETFNQVNRKTETTNGNSTLMATFSDMVKRELKMELPWLFMLRDMKTNSQKQPSLRRLLKIIELLLKTFLANQRIWDKVKQIEELISFMASKTFKVTTHGMLLDASTVNQTKRRFSQTMI